MNGLSRVNNPALVLGGSFSVLAGFMHIGIIIGGEEWYRFFGAGEEMASMAAQGSWMPGAITAGIALILILWGVYAYSGAGLTTRLPFLKPILIAIAGVYLLRGVAVVPALFMSTDINSEMSTGFLLWSSMLSLTFGIAYAVGIRQMIWEGGG